MTILGSINVLSCEALPWVASRRRLAIDDQRRWGPGHGNPLHSPPSQLAPMVDQRATNVKFMLTFPAITDAPLQSHGQLGHRGVSRCSERIIKKNVATGTACL